MLIGILKRDLIMGVSSYGCNVCFMTSLSAQNRCGAATKVKGAGRGRENIYEEKECLQLDKNRSHQGQIFDDRYKTFWKPRRIKQFHSSAAHHLLTRATRTRPSEITTGGQQHTLRPVFLRFGIAGQPQPIHRV